MEHGFRILLFGDFIYLEALVCSTTVWLLRTSWQFVSCLVTLFAVGKLTFDYKSVELVQIYDTRFVWTVLSFGVHRRLVRWKSTDVAEEYVASIFRVEEALVPSCFTLAPCLAYLLTMEVESSCSSEKSVAFQRTAWYYTHIPAENTLHEYFCENVVGHALLVYLSNSDTITRTIDRTSFQNYCACRLCLECKAGVVLPVNKPRKINLVRGLTQDAWNNTWYWNQARNTTFVC
jgi:hypothetical protein